MNIPARLLDFLRQHEVTFQIIHHPVVYTAQEIAAVIGVKGRQLAKVVIVNAGPELTLLVLPADHRIDFARLPGFSLAGEVEFKPHFPDCAPGAVPPFGHLYGVSTLMDKSLQVAESIAFEAGTHSDAIQMSFHDFVRLARPDVAEFAVKAG